MKVLIGGIAVTVLGTFAVKNYNPDVPVYVQLISSKQKVPWWCDADEMMAMVIRWLLAVECW